MQSSRRLKHEVHHEKECRICLAQGGRDLISPCACRGSAEYVHIDCLNQFLRHKPTPSSDAKRSLQTIRCQICKRPYVGIDYVEDIRCIDCSEILNLPQQKKQLVLSFLIGNGLIAAAFLGGVVIFIGGEDIRMILGAIWYAIVVILGIILWMCLWKTFQEYVHVVERRVVRTMQLPLTLKLRPFANPEKVDPRFRPIRRRFKK